jgi:hypothetical protein
LRVVVDVAVLVVVFPVDDPVVAVVRELPCVLVVVVAVVVCGLRCVLVVVVAVVVCGLP